MNGEPYYRDPSSAEWQAPSLVTGLMGTPTTETQTPLERQFTIVVAWLVHHSDQFARALLRRFFDGDGEALETLGESGLRIGARTWGTLRAVDGVTHLLFPDLAITGSGRAFELIVEMKIDAGVHECGVLERRALYQPDAYAYSWIRNYDESKEAKVRRVGTLTREGVGVALWPELDGQRAKDVRWREVHEDLSDLLDRGEIEADVSTVAREALEAIHSFVLATAPPGIEQKLESSPPELRWGYAVLSVLSPSLAEALPGGTLKQPFSLGTKHAYIGCNVYFATRDGERCIWLQVSPADDGYAVPGQPVCLWAVEQRDHGSWPDDVRERAVDSGFGDETDRAGFTALRRGFPMERLVSLGDEAAQAGWLLRELVETFASV